MAKAKASTTTEQINVEPVNGVIDVGDEPWVSPEVALAQAGVEVTYDSTLQPTLILEADDEES
jgi:hypothetical protein